MRYLQFIAITLACLALAAFNFPEPRGRVTDAANLISADERHALELELGALDTDTTWEVYVVTVPNLEGSSPEHYAQELFVHYGIGKKDKNNGVLLLIAKDERKARIHTGYHAESVITDALATRIVREQIAPKSKAGDWSGGIAAGARAVAATIREHHAKASAAPPVEAPRSGPSAIAVAAGIGGFVALVGAIVWAFRRAQRKEDEARARIERDHEEFLANMRERASPASYMAAAAVASASRAPAAPRKKAEPKAKEVERSSSRSSSYDSSSSSSSSSSYDYGGSSGSSDSGGSWGGGGDSGGGGGGGDI